MLFRILFILGLLASECGWAQEPVVITVNKKPIESTTVNGEATGEDSGFNWFGLWGSSRNTSGFEGFKGDLIPSLKTEYDLFTKRSLAFYTCGLDIGTQQLMLGLNLKFPQENGTPTSLEHMRGNLSVSRRWHFKRINMSKYNMYRPKSAFIQYGLSADYTIAKNKVISDLDLNNSEDVFFANLFISVNHPLSRNLLIGLEATSFFSASHFRDSYGSAGLTLRYIFSNSD